MAKDKFDILARLGWKVDDKQIGKFKRGIGSIKNGLRNAALAGGALAAAVAALTVTTNKETSVQTMLAKSLGISGEALDAWSGFAGAIGFDSNKLIRLFKEMNNRLGEFAISGLKSTGDSLKALNIDFKELQKLKPEEQFRRILQATDSLKDGQQARAAASKLLGSEAGKLVGLIRQQGMSVDDIVDKYKGLNALSEEGRESAVDFIGSWDDFSFVLDGIKKEFFGLLGSALKPFLDEFIEWYKANKDVVGVKLKAWVKGVAGAFKFLGEVLGPVFGFFSDTQAMDEMGMRWENMKQLISDLLPIIAGVVAVILLPFSLITLAIAGVIAAGVLLIKHWDDVVGVYDMMVLSVEGGIKDVVDWFVELGEKITSVWDKYIKPVTDKIGNAAGWIGDKASAAISFFGGDSPPPVVPPSNSVNNSVNNKSSQNQNVNINVTGGANQSEASLAREIKRQFNQQSSQAYNNLSTGEEY